MIVKYVQLNFGEKIVQFEVETEHRNFDILKRTVARSRRASRARQTPQVNTPRVCCALTSGERTLSNTPRAQYNLSKLLTALSA